MSEDDFWKALRLIPLYPDFDSKDGKSVICRAQDGTPVSVTKPEFIKREDRQSVIDFYMVFYSPAAC